MPYTLKWLVAILDAILDFFKNANPRQPHGWFLWSQNTWLDIKIIILNLAKGSLAKSLEW